MKREFISTSPSNTKKLAALLAHEALKERRTRALVIALEGELGSGKTTFVQGFAKGLGVRSRVVSPTFLIARSYPLSKKPFSHLYHIDCYRVGPEDLRQIGVPELFSDPSLIVLVEWPERARGVLPRHVLSVRFSYAGENERTITVSA